MRLRQIFIGACGMFMIIVGWMIRGQGSLYSNMHDVILGMALITCGLAVSAIKLYALYQDFKKLTDDDD